MVNHIKLYLHLKKQFLAAKEYIHILSFFYTLKSHNKINYIRTSLCLEGKKRDLRIFNIKVCFCSKNYPVHAFIHQCQND